MNSILFSRKSDNWKTPTHLYKWYIKHGYFDPCPLNSSFDGLTIDWENKTFVNPPFSKIAKFIDKAIEEHKKGKETIVLLIPARTDTKYFRKLVDYGSHIIFITGRLHFNDSASAPFPSCLIQLNGRYTKCYWENEDQL